MRGVAHKTIILASAAASFLCFQNFEGGVDIRELAPAHPPLTETSFIARPQSGHDLGSVGQDWLARQTKLITGPTEERVLAGFNQALNRMLTPRPEENQPEENQVAERAPASVPVESLVGAGDFAGTELMGSSRAASDALRFAAGVSEGTDSNPERDGQPGAESGARAEIRKTTSGLSIAAVRLLAVNKIRVVLKNATQVTCSLEGGSLQLHLTKPIARNLELSVHHEAARAKSVVQLDWSF